MMLETRITARTDSNWLPDTFTAIGQLGYAVYPPAVWNSAMAAGANALAVRWAAGCVCVVCVCVGGGGGGGGG